MVFPAITGNPPSSTILNKEVDCNQNSSFAVTYPKWSSYTGAIPAADFYLGYQAVGLSSDYRPSVTNTTLNATTSKLVESVDWGQPSCTNYVSGDDYGLKDIGGQGSYLAGSITEAQHLLEVNARAGATNAIIVLSDGAMTDPITFTDGSKRSTSCQDAHTAAAQAKATGTLIYSIAYGASGNCADGGYTAVGLMQDIASNSQTFFNQPAAGDLTQAFQQVATDLTNSRLLPDCATPPSC